MSETQIRVLEYNLKKQAQTQADETRLLRDEIKLLKQEIRLLKKEVFPKPEKPKEPPPRITSEEYMAWR